jgi:NTE family protein
VPWIFAPVVIGGRAYVDGGVWSLTNLDVARVGRGSEVLCLSGASVLPLPLRTAAAAAEALEAAALRRQGAVVRTLAPDGGLGPDLMDAGGASGALAAGHRQGRATAPA